MFLGMMRLHTASQQRIVFRALSYYAIQESEMTLLDWLLENGLDMEPISTHTGGVQDVENVPSLLSVVLKQGNAYMLDFLLRIRKEGVDLSSLYHAVQEGADIARLEACLPVIPLGASRRKRQSVPVLQQAVRDQNYSLIRMLAPLVDVDSVVTGSLEDEDKSQPPETLTPLGEAILKGDSKAVGLLLDHGANPNALVCHQQAWDSSRRSILNRATPLLAAIDMGHFPIVELLLANGAASDHLPRQGLSRTPLQRAAEIGNFQVVSHLLECGAAVDSAPCYSGGTPLQLAAMGGYVGIAALLLEQGANINYPPAAEHGLTAFEAAASWGRFDMLSLLVKWKVDLDIVFQPHGIPQHKRALLLAEKHGHMATKRFIEVLLKQRPVPKHHLFGHRAAVKNASSPKHPHFRKRWSN